MKLEKSFKKTELAFCMYHQKLHWLDFKSKVTAFRSSHHLQWEAEDTARGQLVGAFSPSQDGRISLARKQGAIWGRALLETSSPCQREGPSP